jgi:hypothetical protein
MIVIESYRPFVAIGGEVISGFRADKWGPPATRLVAASIALDLDHVSAEIPKQHRAIGASQGFREFNNSDPIEDHAHGNEL